MPTQKRFRKYLLRLWYVGLILAGLLLVSRNFVSRAIAERVGSAVLNTNVQIQAIHIGWGRIQVRGVTLFEPEIQDAAQVGVARVDVTTSIWKGFSDGVWIDQVVVTNPRLHVRFDEEGKLLSMFPTSESSSEGETSIPLRSLLVANAQLIVHQGERKSTVVDDANLRGEFGDSIEIHGRVGKLIKGTVAFETKVDAASFAGSTTMQADGCTLDCESLPGRLLPQSIRDQGIRGTASVLVQVQHPANVTDPRLHPAQIRVRLDDLTGTDFGSFVNEVSIAATNNSDGLVVDVLADLLDGQARIHVTSNSLNAPLQAIVTSEIDDCRLGPLIAHLVPDVDAQVTGSMKTRSQINWNGQLASFKNTIHAVASDLAAEQIELDAVHLEIQCDGATPFDLAARDLPSAMLSGLNGKLTGKITSEGIDLRQLADRSGVASLSGRIRTAATFDLPLDRVLDPNAIAVQAVAQCSEIDAETIQGPAVRLSAMQLTMTVANGSLRATMPSTQIRGETGSVLTTIGGSAMTNLTDKRLDVLATMDNLDAQHVLRLCKLDESLIHGQANGRFEAAVMIDSLTKPQTWTAAAALQTKSVVVAGEPIDDLVGRCELRDGVITIEPTLLKWRENVCELSLDGELTDDLSIESQFAAGPISLSDLADVVARFSATPLPLSGKAVFAGQMIADTQNASLRSTGTASLTDASYAETEIGSANLDWEGDLSGLTIRTRSDDFLGGKYAVTVTARQLDWTQATVESQFTGIQANRLTRLANVEFPVTGTLEGGCKITSLASIQQLDGNAWLHSRGLSMQAIPVDLSLAEVRVQGGEAKFLAHGELLRGNFEASADCKLREMITFANQTPLDLRALPVTAEARLSGLSIQSAVIAARMPLSLRPLSGSINATCLRDAASVRDGLICTATASAQRISWQQSRLSERVTATVRLRPDRVELASINGRFAEGRLNGRATVSLDQEMRGTFQFGAERVNLRVAAAPLGQVSKGVSGSGSVRIDGRIARTITGRLDLTANNPSVSNLHLRAARFPVDWTFTPSTSRATWRCRSGVIEAGDGKINVSTEGDYNRSLNMRLAAQLNKIDTARLLRGGSMGAGILDGQVNLQAKRARRAEQFTGNFDVKMSRVDSLEMPVFDQLNTLISLTPSFGSKDQNNGTIQGRLSGGVVHLDRLTVSQSNVQVVMSGDASLSGRLNFDITAATGQDGPADGLMALTNSPLMMAAPAPVALLLKANEAMKDRVVHVHVAGTASRPILRLQPGKNLTQDTVRFFLTNSFGSQIANAADSSRRQNQKR